MEMVRPTGFYADPDREVKEMGTLMGAALHRPYSALEGSGKPKTP